MTTWLAPGGWRIELGQLLVTLQIAMSIVLLAVAGLFVRTLRNLDGVDRGFRAENVALFTMKHVHERYTPEQIRAFCLELLRRVAVLPGVRSAGLGEAGPLTRRAGARLASIPGSERNVPVTLDRASPGFLRTLGVQVVLGRDFAPEDREGRPPVALIDTETARDLFGTDSPLGRTILLEGGSRRGTYEVVGVIQPLRQISLRESRRSVYVSILQGGVPLMPTLYVQAQGDAGAVIAPVRRVFDELDPQLAVFQVKTMRRQIDESLSTERLTARLSAAFGGIGLAMAFVGILGVMALSVARRHREIGIRIALGAPASLVRWGLIRDSLRLTVVGALLGVPAALFAARLAETQLFGVAAGDPVTLAAVVLVMGVAAVLAALLPAVQASHVDPIIVLRAE
jgi:predicted permease